MNYEVILSARFKRIFKRLSKKYTSLPIELEKLIDSLEVSPIQGTPLGQNCYKIRLAIRSKGAGKRGGARIITYVVTSDEQVILLTIYDKKDKADLEPGDLDDLLADL
ncbi:type II toxin-antitoxin system RelE family toxin [Spirosoma gilvum]